MRGCGVRRSSRDSARLGDGGGFSWGDAGKGLRILGATIGGAVGGFLTGGPLGAVTGAAAAGVGAMRASVPPPSSSPLPVAHGGGQDFRDRVEIVQRQLGTSAPTIGRMMRPPPLPADFERIRQEQPLLAQALSIEWAIAGLGALSVWDATQWNFAAALESPNGWSSGLIALVQDSARWAPVLAARPGLLAVRGPRTGSPLWAEQSADLFAAADAPALYLEAAEQLGSAIAGAQLAAEARDMRGAGLLAIGAGRTTAAGGGELASSLGALRARTAPASAPLWLLLPVGYFLMRRVR